MTSHQSTQVHVVSSPFQQSQVFLRMADAQTLASRTERARIESFEVRQSLSSAAAVLERRVRIRKAAVESDDVTEHLLFDDNVEIGTAEIESYASAPGTWHILAYGTDRDMVDASVDREVQRILTVDRESPGSERIG